MLGFQTKLRGTRGWKCKLKSFKLLTACPDVGRSRRPSPMRDTACSKRIRVSFRVLETTSGWPVPVGKLRMDENGGEARREADSPLFVRRISGGLCQFIGLLMTLHPMSASLRPCNIWVLGGLEA